VTRLGVGLVALLIGGSVMAEPARLRLATMAPEGSGWARPLKAAAKEFTAATRGAVPVKWYLSGIAGDELAMIARLRKGQIDGAALSMGCAEIAPSLNAMRIVGLIRSRQEARYLLGRLQTRVEREMAARGLVLLGLTNLGQIVVFSRRPVRTFADLKSQRLWTWEHETVWIDTIRAAGLQPVPLSVEAAGPAYDAGRVDGFLAVPSSALVYQWTTQTHWFTDLPLGILPGCFVITQAAVDSLTLDQQNALRKAAGKFAQLFEQEGARFDALLTGGLLEKQGLHRVAPDERLVSAFLMASRQAREALPTTGVTAELMRLVMGWLADYRAEYGRRED